MRIAPSSRLRRLGAGFVSHIRSHDSGDRTELEDERFTLRGVQIGDDNVGLVGGEQARGSRTQTRGAAGYQKCAARQLHQ
jgi:hypothetical protein